MYNIVQLTENTVTGLHGHYVLIHVVEDLNQDYEGVTIHLHSTVENNATETIKIIQSAIHSRVQLMGLLANGKHGRLVRIAVEGAIKNG